MERAIRRHIGGSPFGNRNVFMDDDRFTKFEPFDSSPRPPGLLSYAAPRPAPRPPASPGDIRLFQVFGITVFLNWTWFVLAAYELRQGKGYYSSLAWNIAELLGIFEIVLLHEFGHALACRSVGGTANKITLWPLGGLAFVNPPPRPGPTLWSIAAGPLVNVALIPVLILAGAIIRAMGLPGDARILAGQLQTINFMLLVFNILPLYPLDGGQILQSLLWFGIGRARSLLVAATIGLLGAVALGAFGLYDRSLLTVAIAFFIGSQAYNARKAGAMMLAYERRTAPAGRWA